LFLLQEEVKKLREENGALRAEVARLQAENAELRRRLGMNSSNSHKPPSSDVYKKKAQSSVLPKSGGKTQGGQVGHQGKTLEQVCQADKEVIHHPEQCSCCGRKFGEHDAYELLPVRRQVFELPEPRLEVIEHRISCIVCCGQAHLGSFPSEVSAPVQYGQRAKSWMSLLSVEYRLPYHKISQLFSDIFGYALNEGTITSANALLYERCETIEEQIKLGLQSASVVFADETGARVSGKLHWFHTVCNELLTYIFVHPQRGREALVSEASLLPVLQGYVVHDCWSSYFHFEACRRALPIF
jgi:transposase